MSGLTRSPSVSLVIQATIAALTPSTPSSLPTQEVSVSLSTMVAALVPLAAPIMAPPSITVTPLLSVGVVTMSTLVVPPPSSSTSPVSTSFVLSLVLPSFSSCPVSPYIMFILLVILIQYGAWDMD